MFTENVFTIEEVSQHLKVPIDALRQEIAAGRLRAMNVAGYIRVRESDLNSYKGESDAKTSPTPVSESQDRSTLQLKAAPDFNYKWPDEKFETFTGVREGVASYAGKTYHVRVGFTHRESAGKRRLRSLVLIDRYATVEFVSADETSNGRMASIIKDRHGKQLPVGASLPQEYVGLPVGPYRDVVVGPGASNGLAVICESDDMETMVKHALIRYRFREERE